MQTPASHSIVGAGSISGTQPVPAHASVVTGGDDLVSVGAKFEGTYGVTLVEKVPITVVSEQ